uniref:Kinesin-like domain-containing protein n=1 Tax=Romanomermis culicivorax TaxID=13658 RepID=A0A915IQF9_ROMCU
LRIKEASGLPANLSHFVFCQYNFWSTSTPIKDKDDEMGASTMTASSNSSSDFVIVVPPTFDPNQAASNTVHKPEGLIFQFNHEKDFDVFVNDEFLEHVQEDALSVQVWGHRTSGLSCMISSHKNCSGGDSHGRRQDDHDLDVQDLQGNQNRTLQERWADVTRRLKLWIEIHELNDHGQYSPVKIEAQNDVATGGVYILRQGQQRRIIVRVAPSNNYGLLPLVCEEIVSVLVGCVQQRSRLGQKSLDSYQDLDLEILRQKWGDALQERKFYLDDQIQRLINKPDKSEVDVEREQALIGQWVALTEERNAVYVPAPNSNVPGAPAD